MKAPNLSSGQADGHKTASVRLSVSEAAARLDSTPRSVRRWIGEGRLDAEPDPNGRGRLVSLESVEHLKSERDAETEATRTSGRTDTRTQNPVRPAVREPGDESEINLSPGRGRGEMIEQLRSEVEFLRARNAELNAVIMQQARALSSLGSARELESVPEPIEKPGERRETPERTETPARPPERREKRFPTKARPLWQVILGIRPKE